MMLALTIAALLLALGVIGMARADYWIGGRAQRERQRIAGEVRLAEWRMREVTCQAMNRMLDEARRAK